MDLDLQMQLAKNLRHLRKLFGYTQQAVADQLHVGRSTYANYELGKRVPDPLLLCDMAKLYHLDPHMLLRSDCCELMDKAMEPECREDMLALLDTCCQLSFYSQGRLLERAMALLDQEQEAANP